MGIGSGIKNGLAFLDSTTTNAQVCATCAQQRTNLAICSFLAINMYQHFSLFSNLNLLLSKVDH